MTHYAQSPYFHVAHARDLTGKDRALYRALELIPGLLSWGTMLVIVLLSLYLPVVAAYFILAFDLYWLLKTFYLSFHQRHNWRRIKHNIALDWRGRLETLKHEHLYHLILLPYYKESETVVREALESVARSHYDLGKLLVVLAVEERAGPEAQAIAERMEAEYRNRFGGLLVTVHPDGLPGEIRGKGPNITYASLEARDKMIRPKKIPYENIIVSAFDIDTVVGEQFFACLTWHFLTAEDPHHASFQPVPLYTNNIWDAPAVSRVAAFSSTFWQMIQQERAEKLTTFSSHAISFKALEEVGFWQKNMVSDDSRIFWNLYFANDGHYRAVPIAYPVQMDANLAQTTWQTLVNIYQQHFRWMWGVENIPYMLFGFIKNKEIPFRQKVFHTLVQIEGFWSLATAPFMILLLGWLPLVLGGEAFRDTVLSYNLPIITRDLMIVAMIGLVLAAAIAFSFMPKLPERALKAVSFRWTHVLVLLALLVLAIIPAVFLGDLYGAAIIGWLILLAAIAVLIIMSFMANRQVRYVGAAVQWLLVPLTIIIFGAIPGLHAQTRLMFGWYVGAFWVTPKHRASNTTVRPNSDHSER